VIRPWRLAIATLATLLPCVPAQAAFRCDSTTALTLVGLDTEAERALFALPQEEGSAGWLIDADFKARKARAWPEPVPTTRFAGSSGPGAVLAATRCGDQCVQVLRFRDGVWQPIGEPMLASDLTTLHLTWDREGAPWAVLHTASGEKAKRRVVATAYRLRGGDWQSEGAVEVRAIGTPGAVPAPPGEEGITSGDALFAAGGKPRQWLATLPAIPDAASGQIVWLGGEAALYAGPDGKLRRTADGGATWQELRWQPWSGGEGDLSWRPGRDYWIELPDGERAPPPAAIWTDRRVRDKEKLFLAGQTGAGWGTLLGTPQGTLTDGGQRLPYNHLFRFAGERWVHATGCVARQGGAALAIRRFAGGTLADPDLVEVEVEVEVEAEAASAAE
jgi:hypothetical protein